MSSNSHYRLSKSTYTYGKQCLKRLYLHKNYKRLGVAKDTPSVDQAARFDIGTRIGELARGFFPSGVNCTPAHLGAIPEAVATTARIISEKSSSVIYEAAFIADEVFVALDILVLRDDGWHGYEVKSTKSVEDQHIVDAAIQYWVIRRAGVPLVSMSIMHLSSEYIRREKSINIHELFKLTDITEVVMAVADNDALLPTVQQQLACLDVEDVPSVRIGKHCKAPYPCDFIKHCWAEAGVPKDSVLNLSYGGEKSWRLYYDGVQSLKDIAESVPLSPPQRLQVECERTGQAHIDVPRISSFVQSVIYPIYYLDFETIAPAVPLYTQSRCYQPIVFQYSLHIQESPFTDSSISDESLIVHKEFIGDGSDSDPRIPLLEKLISDLGETGSIVVYNKSFEESRLKEMAIDFPAYAETIACICCRLVDLAIPFQRKHYYVPAMKGKYSIKYVLPAVCPSYANSYSELDIKEGLTASNTYMNVVIKSATMDADEKLSSLQNLLAYCNLDTLAMVKIFEALCTIADGRALQNEENDTAFELRPTRLVEDL